MVHIGFNANNREPLLNEDYSVSDMVDMAKLAEDREYDSVWVGDSLLEKPRLEPVSTLAAIAERTDTVKLGTACMLTSLRHPVQFAQAWTTLDMLSDGRTILGACMGTPYEGNRKQHRVVGIPPKKRATALEEGLEVMKELWQTGTVNYSGEIYEFEDVSFDTGNEKKKFRPVQDDPPVLIVSNPSYFGKDPVLDRAVKRIVDIGDGWMVANRADQPDEFEQQWNGITSYAEEQGRDIDELTASYQITININEDRKQAEKEMKRYTTEYYPTIDDPDYDSWGPIGTPDDVIEWIQEFRDRGCDIFIVRFGSDDQREQIERFAEEVLPSFS